MCGSCFAAELYVTTRTMNWLFQYNFMVATKNYLFVSSSLFREVCHKLSDYIVKTLFFLEIHDIICVLAVS